MKYLDMRVINMAKSDGYLKVNQRVFYIGDMDFYRITAVFRDTVWIRNIRTGKLLKGIYKEEIYS